MLELVNGPGHENKFGLLPGRGGVGRGRRRGRVIRLNSIFLPFPIFFNEVSRDRHPVTVRVHALYITHVIPFLSFVPGASAGSRTDQAARQKSAAGADGGAFPPSESRAGGGAEGGTGDRATDSARCGSFTWSSSSGLPRSILTAIRVLLPELIEGFSRARQNQNTGSSRDRSTGCQHHQRG